MFFEGNQWPATFVKWQKQAVERENQLTEHGITVCRVQIDLVESPHWCVKNGFDKTDSAAISSFENETTMELVSNIQTEN